jgi:hypothetical protein
MNESDIFVQIPVITTLAKYMEYNDLLTLFRVNKSLYKLSELNIIFFEWGANNTQTTKNNLLLGYIEQEDLHQIKRLVQLGAEIYKEFDVITSLSYFMGKPSPLHRCISIGNLDILTYFVESCGIRATYNHSYLLRCACYNGKLNLVKYLVSKGADIHARNNHCIRLACEKGHQDIVAYLISKGANIHIYDDLPMRKAQLNGFKDIIDLCMRNI